jgi:hypothetical protein
MSEQRPLSPETRARLQALIERQLPPEEVAEALARSITDDERDEVRALVAWFVRRYPTPLERLAYVRRAYRRWQGRRVS